MALGRRLAEERDRLGLSQERFGKLVGASRDSQANYEWGLQRPDSAYFENIAAAGADVLYILTGTRTISEAALEADLKRYGDAWEVLELALKRSNRNMSPEKKRKAAEALFRASKAQMAGVVNPRPLTALVLDFVTDKP